MDGPPGSVGDDEKPPSPSTIRQKKLDRQRQLMEAKQRNKRMQPGMMKANDDRPRSARSRLNDDATKPLMTGTTNRVNQQAPYGIMPQLDFLVCYRRM
ncbi:hypothetical protein LSAT2_006571 [Lamellibrachia satsuma]|nr:hypothetical protein LSAT2_006571 [Lamellibrachia satsuma]